MTSAFLTVPFPETLNPYSDLSRNPYSTLIKNLSRTCKGIHNFPNTSAPCCLRAGGTSAIMLLGLKTSGLGSHREAGSPKSTETRTARKPRDSRIPSCFLQSKQEALCLSIYLSLHLSESIYVPTYLHT